MMPCTLTDRAPEPLTESTVRRTSASSELRLRMSVSGSVAAVDEERRPRRVAALFLPLVAYLVAPSGVLVVGKERALTP